MRHGGDIYTDGILKGRELLDFSSNINPLGVPESFINNLQEGVENIKVYPDIQYRQSKDHIRQYLNQRSGFFYPQDKDLDFNFSREDLVLGNGAGEIIDIAVSSLNSICIVMPSFIEYEDSAKKKAVKIVYSNLDSNMEIDYNDLAKKVEDVDGIIIGNPNNPNGGIIDKEKLEPIADYCQKHKKRIIIDEAFIEFTGDIGASMLELARKYSCICIIRALTKFYAIPGVRLGYSVCRDNDFNNLMREKQIPWNINTFAELALKYVLRDEPYISETLEWINTEKDFFIGELQKLSIVKKIYPTNSNFVLVKLNNMRGSFLYEELMKKGVLIRTCNNYIGLGEEYVRFAIKSREDNKRLIYAIIGLIKNIIHLVV